MNEGEVLAGRYKLVGEPRTGGMGEVWHAQDTQVFDREVVVKLIGADLSDEEFRERFKREANAIVRLSHPGIPVLHDYGIYKDRMFIVMELVPGQDLANMLNEHPQGLSIAQAIDFGIQIADCLAAVHAKNIVHRDLKPANIMVTPDNRLKIIDFGIAKDNNAETITRTDNVPGTAAYMAPEQWQDHKKVTTGTDLYALGCVLHEILIGEPPFPDKEAAPLMYKHIYDVPEHLYLRVAGIPVELDTLILKMLKKNPSDRILALPEGDRSDRPQPAAAFADELRKIREMVRGLEHATLAVASAGPGNGRVETFIRNGPANVRLHINRDERWRAIAILALPTRQVTALAAGCYRDEVRVLAVVAGGIPYLRHLWGRNDPTLCWVPWWPLTSEPGQQGPGRVIDVAVAASAPDQLDVFALDDSNQVWRRRESQEGGRSVWSPWEIAIILPQNGAVPAIAAASRSYSGRLQVTLAVALDGDVDVRRRNLAGDGDDSSHQREMPTGASAVDIAIGDLGLFVIDKKHSLWYFTWLHAENRWSRWASEPNVPKVATAITAVGSGEGQDTVTVLTSSGEAYCAHLTRETTGATMWSEWTSLGSTL